MDADDTHPCLQAWPSGLKYGILTECTRQLRTNQIAHSGKHTNRERRIEWWGGKLSPEEEAMATKLREARDA